MSKLTKDEALKILTETRNVFGDNEDYEKLYWQLHDVMELIDRIMED